MRDAPDGDGLAAGGSMTIESTIAWSSARSAAVVCSGSRAKKVNRCRRRRRRRSVYVSSERSSIADRRRARPGARSLISPAVAPLVVGAGGDGRRDGQLDLLGRCSPSTVTSTVRFDAPAGGERVPARRRSGRESGLEEGVVRAGCLERLEICHVAEVPAPGVSHALWGTSFMSTVHARRHRETRIGWSRSADDIPGRATPGMGTAGGDQAVPSARAEAG